MAEVIEPRFSQVGGGRVIYELARTYEDPQRAFKEYVTNAIDAIDQAFGKGGLVDILVDAPGRRLIVRDNAEGMSEEKMRRLPQEIGESEKFERQDTRGEKGIGLFAFGSMGHGLHLISKRIQDSDFGHLHYIADEKAKRIKVEFELLKADDVDKFFGGRFRHGTVAAIDVERDVFARNFKDPATINRILRNTYAPLLLHNRISLNTGRLGEETKEVQIDKMRGENLLSNTIGFEARTRGEMRQYGVFVHLNVDAQDNSGTLPVFNHGVRVYNSIIEMDPAFAEARLFTCRQVSGFIDEIGLGLTLGRDGIEKSSNAYRAFRDLLMRVSEDNWPRVEEMLEEGVAKVHDKNARQAYDLVKTAFQSTEPLYKERRIRNPDSNGHVPTEPRSREAKKPREQEQEHAPRRVFPFQVPIFQSFGQSEKGLRSKLDQPMGHPVVAINLDHPHYIQVSARGSKEEIAYIAEVSFPVIAQYEVQIAQEKGIHLGSPGEIASVVGQRVLDLRYAAFNRRG